MEKTDFELGLARAKEEYRDWWNHSWLLENDIMAMFIGIDLHFHRDDDSGGLRPSDSMGFIPSMETWREIVEATERFYDYHRKGIADKANWFHLAKKCMPRKKEPKTVVKKRVTKTGHIYLLSGGGYYKIGKSKNVVTRTSQIMEKLPFKAEVVCTIQSDDMNATESDLHKRFADKRANGEWFELDNDDVEYIKGLSSEKQ